MRGTQWFGPLLAGLALCGPVAAQVSTNSSSSGSFIVTQVPTSTTAGAFKTSDTMDTSFKLSSLLTSVSHIFYNPKQIASPPQLPDPSSPDYLKAFGYQSFVRRRAGFFFWW